MKYNHKLLYRAIADNDIKQAKKIVLRDCEECSVKGDKLFCNEIACQIKMRPEMVELPANLYGLCYKEIPEVSFKANQYYLSTRERKILDKIQAIMSTAQKLQNAGIDYRKSLLLTGESGVGKTEFIRYIACYYKLPLYIVSVSGIVDSYLGGTGKNLSKIFSGGNIMKHGKNPTREQKNIIKSNRLNVDNWLVSKACTDRLELVHRHTDTVRIAKIF